MQIECKTLDAFLNDINGRLQPMGYKVSCIRNTHKYRAAGIYPFMNPHGDFADDCHKNINTCDDSDAATEKCFAVAIEGPHAIESYLTFTVERNEMDGSRFVLINFSCTKRDKRRIGLSMILRLIPFLYAKESGIPCVASDTNEKSSGLLIHKYGFQRSDDYLQRFNWAANTWVETASPEFARVLQLRLAEVGVKYPKHV